MRRINTLTFALAAAAALSWAPGTAGAQEFKFGEKAPEVKGVEWKASAQAGMIITTGNSSTATLAAGANASRKQGMNMVQVEGVASFARSTLLIANDINGNGTIDGENEIERNSQTTSRMWALKGRYDRFLTLTDSLYGAALVSSNVPGGKDLVIGGQLGYSRLVFKDDTHEVKAEAGYDYSFEDLTAPGDGVSIHSLRAFAGYTGKLSPDTGLGATVEGLFNINSLDTPLGEASAFEDTRVNATLSLTTKLFTDISFRFGFTANYDRFPAPRPPIAGIDYAPGFVPAADELDTKTEATLIINFL